MTSLLVSPFFGNQISNDSRYSPRPFLFYVRTVAVAGGLISYRLIFSIKKKRNRVKGGRWSIERKNERHGIPRIAPSDKSNTTLSRLHTTPSIPPCIRRAEARSHRHPDSWSPARSLERCGTRPPRETGGRKCWAVITAKEKSFPSIITRAPWCLLGIAALISCN